MIKKILQIAIVLFSSCVLAQELHVKSFMESSQDLSARIVPRKDLNDVDCALVKVQIVGQDVMFGGNVMGNVDNKGNEYWVYMTNGSKRLKVTHPDCLPLDICFADYGISKINSKTTYKLILEKKEPNITEKQSGTNDNGYLSILSERKLTPSDLAGKTKKELEILRNMIYARNGYRFKRNDLYSYFSRFSWYQPTTSDAAISYNKMTSIERYNIDFIKKHEK